MTHWDDTGGLDDLIKRDRVQSIGGKAIVKKPKGGGNNELD